MDALEIVLPPGLPKDPEAAALRIERYLKPLFPHSVVLTPASITPCVAFINSAGWDPDSDEVNSQVDVRIVDGGARAHIVLLNPEASPLRDRIREALLKMQPD